MNPPPGENRPPGRVYRSSAQPAETTVLPAGPTRPTTYGAPRETTPLLSPAEATRLAVVISLVISLVVAVGTAIDLSYPGRAVLTVAFVLIVPGWVTVSYLSFRERLVEVTAAIGLSISMGLLLAMTQLVTHFWHPRAAVAVWAGATAVAALPHLLHRRA